ncbi:MAG: MotA/TolQ/ExbB proton channel family protein [Planctomycetes bacterium]|nr:MotA/TolQ/ExbB proton channel family protein [Planctomycetota bacterium]
MTLLVFLCAVAQPLSGQAQETADRDSAVQVQDDQSAATAQSRISADPGTNNETSNRSAILRNPMEIINRMGTLGWIFLTLFSLASIIALWFAIERFVVLRRSRVIPRHFVERFLQHLEQRKLTRDDALRLCEENASPMAAVFSHGIRKWGKPSVEVEQAIIDGGERQVSLLRKHLRVLNGVATVTPLIGLLGTVCGMILAFDEIAASDAMGKAGKLGSDIGLALVTTAAGLTIAIPSLITYMFLAGRVDSLVMEMDLHAQDVVHLISSEALSEKTVPSPRMRKANAPPEKKAV